MSSNNIDPQIITNMRTHYLGLMKVGATDFGGDFMAKAVFDMVNTDKKDGLTQSEIDAAMPNIDQYIAKSIEKDSFYAEIAFGQSYTDAAAKTDKNSQKTVSEQIVENNLNEAVAAIYSLAEKYPDSPEFNKYAKKLKEIQTNGQLILTHIGDGVAGRAIKNDDGTDTILIENKHSIFNLTPEYLVKTLLHELEHTFEDDDINSQSEEINAEINARTIAEYINEKSIYSESLSSFAKSYSHMAKVSPGHGIPVNTGMALWYIPEEVIMDEETHTLVIRSEVQEDLKGATIEEHIVYGDKKDELGKPLPVSAERIIKDKEGNVIFSMDYGKYDSKKKSFNYQKMYMEQVKLKQQINPNSFLKPS